MAFLGLLNGMSASADVAPVPERSGQHVVVGPGDTLLSIARDHVGQGDLVQFVDQMTALNGGEAALEVGQVLALPLLR